MSCSKKQIKNPYLNLWKVTDDDIILSRKVGEEFRFNCLKQSYHPNDKKFNECLEIFSRKGKIGDRQIKSLFDYYGQLIFYSDTDEKEISDAELKLFKYFNYEILPPINVHKNNLPIMRNYLLGIRFKAINKNYLNVPIRLEFNSKYHSYLSKYSNDENKKQAKINKLITKETKEGPIKKTKITNKMKEMMILMKLKDDESSDWDQDQ